MVGLSQNRQCFSGLTPGFTEELEQKLYNKFKKLNLNTPQGVSDMPDWFRGKHNTLQALGQIQENQSRFPVVAELGQS